MTRVYYKEAVGAFIVFDVTRADSFRAVDKWKADLDTKVRFRLFKSFFYVWKIKNKINEPYLSAYLTFQSFSE